MLHLHHPIMQALIVEGNPIFQVRLRNLIKPFGFDTTLVDSVESAQTQLDNVKFDLLICEIVLKDGIIFDIASMPNTPTVFITELEDELHMQKTLRFRQAQFLVKPFADLTMLACIERLLNGEKQRSIKVFGKHKNPIEIFCREIEFVESEGNYSYIYTDDNQKYVIKRSAKYLMSQLTDTVFVRVKRSTFVNKSKITSISLAENLVFTQNNEFLVSKSFKKNLYEFHLIDK